MQQRVRQRLNDLRISPAEAERRGKFSKGFVQDLLDGHKQSIRPGKLIELAIVLQCSVDFLTCKTDEVGEPPPSDALLGPLPVDRPGRSLSLVKSGGIVEAGAFRRADLAEQRDDALASNVPPIPGYPGVGQTAYLVMGDSMDEAGILPGMTVVALDYGDYVDRVGSLRDGAVVVVRRTRDDGAEVEQTVKRVRFMRDRIELHPQSRNPKHQPIVIPIDHEADDGVEVAIIGVVKQALHEF